MIPACETNGTCGPDDGHTRTLPCVFAPVDMVGMNLACRNGKHDRCTGVSPQGWLDGFPAPECPCWCHYSAEEVCSICGGRGKVHQKPCYVVKGVLNPLREAPDAT